MNPALSTSPARGETTRAQRRLALAAAQSAIACDRCACQPYEFIVRFYRRRAANPHHEIGMWRVCARCAEVLGLCAKGAPHERYEQ